MRNLVVIDSQLKKAKKKLASLYESKGYTDSEILKLSEKIDRLINERDKLIKKLVS